MPFRPLDNETMKNILASKVRNYEQEVKQQHNIQLEIAENVWLPQMSDFDPSLGARPIVSRMEQEISAEIGKALLDGLVKKGERLQVSKDSGKLKLQLART